MLFTTSAPEAIWTRKLFDALRHTLFFLLFTRYKLNN